MPQADLGNIQLEYERAGAGEPLLLIMGIGAQLVLWPDGLLEALHAQGFATLRYDHRDVGRSTWMKDAPTPPIGRLLARRAAGLPVAAPYSLSDLARDAAGLMDHVGWARAHVVGVSMGGMVAQHLAIEHPERVISLTSVMSTTGARFDGLPKPAALRALLSPRPTTEDGAAEWFRRFQDAVAGPGFPYDPAAVEAVARLAYRRGANPAGFARHFAAILASGDRTEALRGLRAPTLVLHGGADPLVPPSGGRATAAAVPGAKLKVVPGWGHGLPPGIWPTFIEAIGAHAKLSAG